MLRTAIVAATLVATTATAQEGFMGWTGQADANLLVNQGNTDNSTFGAAIKGAKDWGVWGLEGNFGANVGKTDGDRDAEKYNVGIQGNRQIIDANTYAFAGASYENDNFSGYEYIADQVVGLGRKFMDDGVYMLKGQLGIGAQETETEAGVDSTEFVTKPELNFAWNITDSLQFTQDLSAAIASDLTTTRSRTAIRNQLAGNLFLQAAYELTNRSDVPTGFKKTDTATTLGLSYGF